MGCLVVSVGCGGSDWSYVEGDIHLNGKPFGPGMINFKPASPSEFGGGVGEIDAKGHYVVRSSGRKEGLAAGEYLIAISDEVLVGGGENTERSPGADKLPAKYKLTATSGLTRTIEPGKSTVDFSLEF